MEALKQIANIAGQSGLFRILKPSRTGVIVESLDDKKAKTMMGPTARVSVLNDISIYVDTPDQSIPLANVLTAINEKYGENLTVNAKGSNDELADFMESVVPEYDRERVRASDIRKLITWYGILRQYAPEVFETQEAAPAPEAETAPETTDSAETQEESNA
ncbi:hypothetical protein BN8_00587 [Fibrisoma limi BUZ 3]|uniref:Uncharacterized protein n=1 Tax=Fibrisoma limi BUZ 3 TaxID=1185876 RepID=I2GCM2_9BACT|nr:DUF5606 domain-containing protein [Fibrisoma limi]CCH51646.1 hypothetical protein BN8_00587 [Fibrisoma limi BUZ 3]